MRMLSGGIAIVLIAGACTGSATDSSVSNHPSSESCNDSGVDVYLPVLQGPAEARHASRATVDCILDAYAAGEGKEAKFVLVGDQERSSAIIQTLPDGSVNYYVHTDAGDVETYEGCATLTFSWFFSVSDCLLQGS